MPIGKHGTYSSLGNEYGVFAFLVFSALRSCFFFDLWPLLRSSRVVPRSGGLELDACREDLALLSGSEGIHPSFKGAVGIPNWGKQVVSRIVEEDPGYVRRRHRVEVTWNEALGMTEAAGW